MSFRMSWKVFRDFHSDKIFWFSKTLIRLTIIGRINLLPCLILVSAEVDESR